MPGSTIAPKARSTFDFFIFDRNKFDIECAFRIRGDRGRGCPLGGSTIAPKARSTFDSDYFSVFEPKTIKFKIQSQLNRTLLFDVGPPGWMVNGGGDPMGPGIPQEKK